MSMNQAHALADRIEQHIQERLPAVKDIVVHLEPAREGARPELANERPGTGG